MTHASLFSGIGGPEVAAAMLGWTNAFHCEINPFGRQVLEYWFPDSVSYEDITKTDFKQWRGRIDVLTGGFPCQPFSYAGKRGGQEDERYLWPEMLRAIGEIRPAWVVGENVAGLATMAEGWILTEMGSSAAMFEEDHHIHEWLVEQTFTIEKISKELEELGYSVQPVLIPAAAVGAPHRRDRIFILAHSDAADTELLRLQYNLERGCEAEVFGSEGRGRKDGVPAEVQLASAKGAGDASSDTDRRGGDEGHKHVESRIADGTKPLRDGRKQDASHAADAGIEMQRERADAICLAEYVTDAHGPGLQESQQPGRRADRKEAGAGLDDRALGSRRHEDFADTYYARLSAARESGRYDAKERDGAGRSAGVPAHDAWIEGTWWDNFPTVSPVHARNDGLSFRMDGASIPFGRWRTEALKAYGNAIVPQVMYRIFQAIEEVCRA